MLEYAFFELIFLFSLFSAETKLLLPEWINHELLIAKLHGYGFSIDALKFLTRKVAKSQDQYNF